MLTSPTSEVARTPVPEHHRGHVEAGTAAAPPGTVVPTLAYTVSNGVRTDEYDCSQILESYRSGWNHFCHVTVEDCRLTVRCYGHDWSLTGEDPWDTLVVDHCA